ARDAPLDKDEAPEPVGPHDHTQAPGIVTHVEGDEPLARLEEALAHPRPDAAEGARHHRGHAAPPPRRAGGLPPTVIHERGGPILGPIPEGAFGIMRPCSTADSSTKRGPPSRAASSPRPTRNRRWAGSSVTWGLPPPAVSSTRPAASAATRWPSLAAASRSQRADSPPRSSHGRM